MEWAFAGDASLLRNDMRNKPVAARANVKEWVHALLRIGIVTRPISAARH